MNPIVRPASANDVRQMSELLNQIIDLGGTTALTETIRPLDITNWMARHAGRNAWHVAESQIGDILGFQFIEPHVDLPSDAADIATFVRVGTTKLGIGSKLFSATEQAARDLEYVWLNATIRADNTGGLTYYQSRGFRTYHQDDNVKLGNGLQVSKISKRYDLWD